MGLKLDDILSELKTKKKKTSFLIKGHNIPYTGNIQEIDLDSGLIEIRSYGDKQLGQNESEYKTIYLKMADLAGFFFTS